jgi:hypothetical protein
MLAKKWLLFIAIVLFYSMCLTSINVFAQTAINPFGQIIKINTRFHSFVGKPIWTLIIRDIDHNQNIPYVFDIRKGENHWIIPTYARNYLITVSRMQIETYRMGYNKYRNIRLKNFCSLESNGKIIRNESMSITIDGDLSPYTDSFTCDVSTYPDPDFYIYRPPIT